MTEEHRGWRARPDGRKPFVSAALSPFSHNITFEGFDRWTAGGLAVCSIMRGIVEGADAAKVREFIRWLTRGDLIKTEDLILLDTLKRIVDAGGEVTVERVESSVFPDAVHLGRFLVQSYVVRRESAPVPDDGPKFQEVMEILEGLRAVHNRERMAARREAVPIARRILDGATGRVPMSRVQSLVVVIALLAAQGCSAWHEYRVDREIENMRAAALAKIDVAECEARGGTVRGVCMFGIPACVVPYPDAGQPCTDGSECEGRCWIDAEAAAELPADGAEVTGFCTENAQDCLCGNEVVGGRIANGICED